jgi:hypothetical protein
LKAHASISFHLQRDQAADVMSQQYVINWLNGVELLGRVCLWRSLQVTGLKGLTYLDKSKDPKNPAKKTEDRDIITFGKDLVDTVYLAAPEHVELDVGTGQWVLQLWTE